VAAPDPPRRPSARNALLLSVLLLVASVGGCWCADPALERVPRDLDWALGDQIARQLAGELRFAEEPAVRATVERLGRRLAAQTQLAHRPWTFHVVRDPALNAFALPGGHVYVHTGLVEAAGSEAELAGVLAHEVAHVSERHGVERLAAQLGVQLLGRIVLGEEAGVVERIAAELLASGALAKFSRDDEREADRVGLRLLARAGFPPEAMARMFQVLLEARRRRPNAVERFFASHPVTEERIRDVRERAQETNASLR
jgi:predicted Zn-dependent protease